MLKLKELRKARNLTQAELAKLLDVDRTTVAQWENGVNMPRAKMLIKLAKIFKCKVDALLCS
ncbi:helix-turn-helix transcriptional regulator [Selenomonas sp. AE3005]|uniref:helix-turn-helix transcriptional regulator n=1 Tax=Selenomonas sp. AE3005 TaxID=1485543 RepID=UPI0025E4E262|nr:helix-turn-helix transcriptional regulator [Selenomonas sp. AE3005]